MFKKLILPVLGVYFFMGIASSAETTRNEINYQDSTIVTDTIDTVETKHPCSRVYGHSWNTLRAHPRMDSVPLRYKIHLDGFSMPTDGNHITSGYGPRWGRVHKGVDIRASIGDTVYSAWDGKVRVVRYEHNGYGNFVVIRHHNGLETVYGHLSKHLVAQDQTVKAGEAIGLAGNTGRSTGPHLHFETRFCGRAINPSQIVSFASRGTKSDSYIFNR